MSVNDLTLCIHSRLRWRELTIDRTRVVRARALENAAAMGLVMDHWRESGR